MRVSPILILIALATLPTSLRAGRQTQHSEYTLVLQSSDLPEKDRQDILKNIDVSRCPLEAANEIVLQKARDLGYLQAQVEEQRQESNNHVQVTENIKAGIRYRLGTINVVKATVFTPDHLRREVPIAPGDVASRSEIVSGLERIRTLYGSKGYVNTVIVPVVTFDSRHGLVDFTFEVDEGRPSRLGELRLDGVEPYPGAAKQLTASWAPLREQLFNPSVIDKWLQANRLSCPSCTWQRNLSFIHRNVSGSTDLLDVTLEFPPHPLQ
ncbi:MAG TPA: POTRA domain-containing protein [Acidobacteriaceae bacterium]|nr:POTRA domain-containing protein [Acidobacteriaceae bacterium]